MNVTFKELVVEVQQMQDMLKDKKAMLYQRCCEILDFLDAPKDNRDEPIEVIVPTFEADDGHITVEYNRKGSSECYYRKVPVKWLDLSDHELNLIKQ